jgi:hypothetical protein
MRFNIESKNLYKEFDYFQAKLKEEEKKDKKRSPLLPWTKGKNIQFLFIILLVFIFISSIY